MSNAKLTAADGGTVTLSTPKGLYTPEAIQELLEKSVTAPEDVKVEDGVIVVNSADKEAAEAQLMTLGIEILQDSGVTAYAKAEMKINAASGWSPALVGEGENSAWLLIAGTEPVARIGLAKQDDASSIAGFFRTNEYINTVNASFQKYGVAKTLENLRAEVIDGNLSTPTIQASTNVDAQITAGIERWINAQNMALQAATKNVVKSPIKAALFEVMKAHGVQDPVAAVEAAFAAMPAHFEVVNAKAREYFQMVPEALKATADMLTSMEVLTPAPALAAPVSAHSKALAAGNAPIAASVEVPTIHAQSQAQRSGNVRDLISSSLSR